MRAAILILMAMISGCASAPRNTREALDDVCDDDDCPPAQRQDVIQFLRQYGLMLVALILTGCGAGVQSVCGVSFSDNGAGAVVSAHDVAPLPMASFKQIDADTWQLESGGFASASDSTCQFGVRNGHIYR